MDSYRPLAAFGLVLAGGVLFLLEAAVLFVAGGVASSVGAAAAGALVGAFGLLVLLFSLILLGLAVAIYRSEEHLVGLGLAAIVFFAIGFVLGGGFYLGSILGIIGGVLALRWDGDDPTPALGVSWEPTGPAPSNAGFGAPGAPPPAPPVRAVPSGRCANCASTLPVGATTCPVCETPVPRATPRPRAT
jgi:hypothetical protein